MLSKLAGRLIGRTAMEVYINLDRDDAIYTNQDTISGDIILITRSSMKISTITVNLSGIATSRLDQGKSEVHQVLQKTEIVFPLDSANGVSCPAIGKGSHFFPFSITFPQDLACYKSGLDGPKAESRYLQVKHGRNETHLLRRLPPSLGANRATAEIKYSLKVVVKGIGIPLTAKSKQTHDISFLPLSQLNAPQSPFKKREYLNIDSDNSGSSTSLLWQTEMELLNGPYLLIGQPIPLRVNITKLRGHDCEVWLNEFQTMLIETTQTKAQSSTNTYCRSWTVQTVANMKRKLCGEDVPVWTTIDLPKAIWMANVLSLAITPSFEVCNIKRTYELEIRLGLQVGFVKPRVIIREFRFPVFVAATELPKSQLSGTHRVQSLSREPKTWPDPELTLTSCSLKVGFTIELVTFR